MPKEAASDTTGARVSMQTMRGCVVVTIQVDLYDSVRGQFQQDVLERVKSSGARGVILDVSGVAIMDAHVFNSLRKTIAMASLLGASSVLVGLQPGIVSSLVDIVGDFGDLRATLDLEEAFAMLQPNERKPEAPEEGEAVRPLTELPGNDDEQRNQNPAQSTE